MTRTRLSALLPAALLGPLLGSACDSEAAETRVEQTSATLDAPEGESLLEVTVTRPEEPRLGHELRYEVRIENVADRPVEGVRVAPPVWAGFEVLGTEVRRGDGGEAAEAAAQEQPAAQERTPTQAQETQAEEPTTGVPQRAGDGWRIGALAAGEVATLVVHGIPHEEGHHELAVEVDYDAPVRVAVDVVDPELRLARTFARDTWWACEEIEARYVVTNKGTGTARAITVEDRLPEGLRTEDGEHVVRFETEVLGPGDTSEHEVTLRAERAGAYRWRASASAGKDSLRTQATTLRVLQPELRLRVEEPQETLRAGMRAAVTVTVENAGEGPADDVAVTVEESENVEELAVQGAGEIDGDRVVLGRLEQGATQAFELRFRPEERGDLLLELRARARCLADDERYTQRLRASVEGVPASRLEVVDEDDPVRVGEETVYRIRVVNQGTGVDHGIRVRATLPETFALVDTEGATTPQQEDPQSGARVVAFGTVETLGAGEDAAWRIRARAIAPGEGKLLVELRSDALGSVVREEEPTQAIE